MSETTESSALHGLDSVLSAPKRLAIMAVLASSSTTDFTFLKQHLRISDSDLSKQASALEAAGYLQITKSGRGRGATTSYRATKAGRSSYQQHRTALQRLLADG